MNSNIAYTAEEALNRLIKGNKRYLKAKLNGGDISPARREQTYTEGQKPYAIIVTCSDSRVMPESIFRAGIGELFIVRVAGNVIDDYQLGSILYAVNHLSCRLIIVMGHDNCGAVKAAIQSKEEGYIKFITDEIKRAIGEETDDYKASCLNVQHAMKKIEECPELREKMEQGLEVRGAIYHLKDGRAKFL